MLVLWYRERIESHFQLNDSRCMWQGLRTICAFGNKSSVEVRADPLLADELNTFYGRFECNGGCATLPISASGSSRQSSDNHVITVSEDEVRRALKRVNVRKAAGPDGITGRVLRSCADQLAGLFTSIFNESLATSVVPTSFKKSIIIPVPNAKFTLHDFSPIFHSPTGVDKSPTNARDRREIGARSRAWQLRSVNYQRRDLRESPTRRQRPQNIWHAKYLELSAILNPAVWMSSDRSWLKNTSAMTYSQFFF